MYNIGVFLEIKTIILKKFRILENIFRLNET
jgi:hypothetical protein